MFDLEISPQQYLREVDDQYDPTSTNDCYKFAVSPSESGTFNHLLFPIKHVHDLYYFALLLISFFKPRLIYIMFVT